MVVYLLVFSTWLIRGHNNARLPFPLHRRHALFIFNHFCCIITFLFIYTYIYLYYMIREVGRLSLTLFVHTHTDTSLNILLLINNTFLFFSREIFTSRIKSSKCKTVPRVFTLVRDSSPQKFASTRQSRRPSNHRTALRETWRDTDSLSSSRPLVLVSPFARPPFKRDTVFDLRPSIAFFRHKPDRRI